MTDTELGVQFWRDHPHLFVPAHWGPKYCRCCLDPKRRKIHEVAIDSATHVGNCTDYRVSSKPGNYPEVCYAVTGWNDDGGSCHYQTYPTYEEALAFADNLKEVGDVQRDGRRWDHLQIDERHYFVGVDTNVVVLS